MAFLRVAKNILGLLLVFSMATGWLVYLTTVFRGQAGVKITFPSNLDQLKQLSSELEEVKNSHMSLLLLLFCSAYLYKQTFAIPGSVFMNLLGGALFGVKVAFPICSLLTACGATLCYLLSLMFGRSILKHMFPSKLASVEEKVRENEDNLFFFLLSARLFPMTPNWLMNVTFPVIGIKIVPFFLSVLFGLMPYNFVCVQTGSILVTLKSVNDMFSYQTLICMLGIAFVAVVPGILLKRRAAQLKQN